MQFLLSDSIWWTTLLVKNSIVAYFCLNNTRGNWVIVIIHFPWLFPDHFSISWLIHVFQKSGQCGKDAVQYIPVKAEEAEWDVWVECLECVWAVSSPTLATVTSAAAAASASASLLVWWPLTTCGDLSLAPACGTISTWAMNPSQLGNK